MLIRPAQLLTEAVMHFVDSDMSVSAQIWCTCMLHERYGAFIETQFALQP